MKVLYRGLWIALLACIIAGLVRLRFDVEVLDLLPDRLPTVKGLKVYQQNFANAQELIITLHGPGAEQTETAARLLAEALRRRSSLVSVVNWQPAWLERPEEIAELISFLWLNQKPADVAELAARLSPANLTNTLAKTRDDLASSLSPMQIGQLSYDPYGLLQLPESASASAGSFGEGQQIFASSDGTFRLLFVQASPDISAYHACRDWLAAVQQLVDAARQRPNFPAQIAIGYTGRPAFVTEIAGGMEHDMVSSVGLTALIIAILFWLAHRRWIPMIWLLVLLALILLGTLGLGGLIFGRINVVSLGFAAILLGLAVDYAVVHYQEAVASPGATIPEIRRAIGPSILWAAITTISAFLVLNLGGLPGLAQLGTLVALGVGLSALVMLFAFLPPLFRDRVRLRAEAIQRGLLDPAPVPAEGPSSGGPSRKRLRAGLTASVLFILATGFILQDAFPRLDHSANALRPRDSAAYAALDEIKRRMASGREPLWVLVQGRGEAEVARSWDLIMPILDQAVSNKLIASFTVPIALWPRPDYQATNKSIIRQIVSTRETLRETATALGFTTNAFALTENLLATWESAANQTKTFWPTNATSRWILSKIVARPGDQFLAVGYIFPKPDEPVTLQSVAPWAEPLSRNGFIVSGWELLGPAILSEVQKNLWKVVIPMIVLVLLTLWLAFRRPTEILLSVAVLSLSAVTLLATMKLLGWSWNLLNLMAIPLMLGAGVDYSIFMQLALRRHNGDLTAAHRSVGRALLLCGATAAAGFGSLGLSTNAGMASLGQVCAVGIAANMAISVYLLPLWWHAARGHRSSAYAVKQG